MTICAGEDVDTLIHTLWDCPHLKSFWNKIFTLISKVTDCLTKPNAALALLNIGVDVFPDKFRSMVIHILFIDRLMILWKWRGSLVSNISDVKTRMNLTASYEHCLAPQLEKKVSSIKPGISGLLLRHHIWINVYWHWSMVIVTSSL